MEPKIGSGSSGSVFIDGSAGLVLNGSGFRFPVRFQRFLKHHFGIMLGSFWDHFGIILGSFWEIKFGGNLAWDTGGTRGEQARGNQGAPPTGPST